MRLSAILLVAALAGIIGGGWLIGHWTGVGAGVVFDSLCVGVWALLRDDGTGQPARTQPQPTTLHEVLNRARAS